MIIPTWAKIAAAAIPAALFATLAGMQTVRLANEQAEHARDNGAADKRQADALAFEITRHNAIVAALKEQHEQATAERQQLEQQAAAALAARDAATAQHRRLRDAAATDILAARAQASAAGAAPHCAAALTAAELRDGLLRELDATAERLAGYAQEVGGYADAAAAAGRACVRAWEVSR